jgi:hypothetical protein
VRRIVQNNIMNPFKFIDKLVKSQYAHYDGYTLKFKWHIFIPRFILILPFWVLFLLAQWLKSFAEFILDKIDSVFPQMHTYEKMDK